MNIRLKLYIEKDIYGIKLLSLDDILNIPPTILISYFIIICITQFNIMISTYWYIIR